MMGKTRDDGQTVSPVTKWTVMVLMGVDTEAGNSPMYEAAIADLAEMAAVGSGTVEVDGKPAAELNIMVQVHAHGVIRRSRIVHEQLEKIRTQQFDALESVGAGGPGGPSTLQDFIEWAVTGAKHTPGDDSHRSMLVLWGHAYDFAIGHAPAATGTIDALDFVELPAMLDGIQQSLQRQLRLTTPPKFDIVAFDACDVATVELACALAPFADYLLASQVGVPIPGWPYEAVLGRLRAPFGRVMHPSEVGAWVINRYCERYSERGEVSLSMLDLKRAAALRAHVSVFAEALEATIDRDEASRDMLIDTFMGSLAEEGKPYVDVADLCLALAREFDDPLVAASARALGDFLIAPPRNADDASSSKGQGLPFVVANGRVGGETARLNGVNLYSPHVAPDYDFIGVRRLYEGLELSRSTCWSSVVHRLATADDATRTVEEVADVQ